MDDPSGRGAPAGLFRRLAALAYDALLVVALWFVVTFAMLPLSSGEAILASSQGLVARLYHAVLLLLTAAYFGFCWMRGGQTLGMRAWRIRLLAADGRAPGLAAAAIRFATGALAAYSAALGIWYWQAANAFPAAALLLPVIANFAWIPFDPARRSLQDRAAGLRMLRCG